MVTAVTVTVSGGQKLVVVRFDTEIDFGIKTVTATAVTVTVLARHNLKCKYKNG